jgi:uncharacterized membrane protein
MLIAASAGRGMSGRRFDRLDRASAVGAGPGNTLKFVVGIMLSAFGAFWTGEGLGVAWPGSDLAIVGFAAIFLAVSAAAVALARRPRAEVVS